MSGLVGLFGGGKSASSQQTAAVGLQVQTSVNGKPIESVETLRAVVRGLKSGDPVVLQIEREGGLQYLAFEME